MFLCCVCQALLFARGLPTQAQTSRYTAPPVNAGQESVLQHQSSASTSTRHPLLLKFEVANSGGIPDSVLLTGLPANHDASDFTGSDKVFAVYVAGEDLPSMAGRYENTKEGVRFTPRFPFEGGLTYEAKVSPKVSPGESCEIGFRVPISSRVAPRVETILPLADELPENILRFYIRFSEPMAEGESLKHVRLWDDTSGEELTGVFFDHVHELWSADRRQITLLVDPGRVKTGLVANLGPVGTGQFGKTGSGCAQSYSSGSESCSVAMDRRVKPS